MTDIEVYQPPPAPVALLEIDSWTAVASQVIRLAKEIYDTPFVPDGLRGSVPAVAAAILAGRELGLGPMTSLANIHLIKGKPALAALLMRALIQSRGHQWQDVETTDTRAVIRARRKGESEWTTVQFTADQARHAKIDLGGYPQDKLYARATSRLARRKFADVIAGMPYSAEELEDGEVPTELEASPASSNGSASSVESKPPRTARRAAAKPAAPKDEGAGPEPSHDGEARAVADAGHTGPDPSMPPLPGEDEAPAPGDDRHRKLTGAVQGHMKRLGFTVDDADRAERLTVLAKLAGISYDADAISSTGDFDQDELKLIADTLARCKNRAALNALLETGEGDG